MLTLWAVAAQAQPFSCPSNQKSALATSSEVAERETAPVLIDADLATSQGSEAILRGNVKLVRGDQQLQADELEYDYTSQSGQASGGVRYQDIATSFTADHIDLDLRADQARLTELSYRLHASSGRGEASSAELSDQLLNLDQVSYTTCPQGDPGWSIEARDMALDQLTGRGTARNAKLRFQGIPFLYLPYASFPIDDRRQSGWLYPTLGSSNDNGLDLSVPYYWSISANQDATLAPRMISDRGLMLEGEYRYLTRHFGRGQIDFQYLPDDDLNGQDRGYARLRHRGRVTNHWSADVDINDVSDVSFFEDFGDSLLGASPSYLRSRGQLTRRGSWWRATVSVDDYEIVDANVTGDLEPYARLPRLSFAGTREINYGLLLDAELETAAFRRDEGLEGNRLDTQLSLSRPWIRPGYYLAPSLGLRHTRYDLDRALNDDPDRTLPIASLEGGLSFERSRPGGGWQTLEPRFQALYVPFEEQSDLPLFDTRELTFSYGQLFRTNRFSGADRQADARQLSLGVSSRLYDQAGNSPLQFSLGTIVYFSDLKVQRSGDEATRPNTSPLVGEMRYRPSQRWSLGTTLQWDPEDNEVDQAIVDLRHRGDDGQLINFAYRQRRNLLEQLDASALYPLNERWNLLGRWNYSLRDNTTLEALAGFEYESCCWTVRLFGRQYLRNQEGDKRNGLLLELELKGLGSLGRASQELLEKTIAGYRSPASY